MLHSINLHPGQTTNVCTFASLVFANIIQSASQELFSNNIDIEKTKTAFKNITFFFQNLYDNNPQRFGAGISVYEAIQLLKGPSTNYPWAKNLEIPPQNYQNFSHKSNEPIEKKWGEFIKSLTNMRDIQPLIPEEQSQEAIQNTYYTRGILYGEAFGNGQFSECNPVFEKWLGRGFRTATNKDINTFVNKYTACPKELINTQPQKNFEPKFDEYLDRELQSESKTIFFVIGGHTRHIGCLKNDQQEIYYIYDPYEGNMAWSGEKKEIIDRAMQYKKEPVWSCSVTGFSKAPTATYVSTPPLTVEPKIDRKLSTPPPISKPQWYDFAKTRGLGSLSKVLETWLDRRMAPQFRSIQIRRSATANPGLKKAIEYIKNFFRHKYPEVSEQDFIKNAHEISDADLLELWNLPVEEFSKYEYPAESAFQPSEMKKPQITSTSIPSKKEEPLISQFSEPPKKEERLFNHPPVPLKKEEPLINRPPVPLKKEEPLINRPPTSPKKEEPLINRSPISPKKEEPLINHPLISPKKEEPLINRPPISPKKEEPLINRPPTSPKKEEPLINQPPTSPKKEELPVELALISPKISDQVILNQVKALLNDPAWAKTKRCSFFSSKPTSVRTMLTITNSQLTPEKILDNLRNFLEKRNDSFLTNRYASEIYARLKSILSTNDNAEKQKKLSDLVVEEVYNRLKK